MKKKTNSIFRLVLQFSAIIITMIPATANLFAAGGNLDLTFDADGKVTTDFSTQGDTANGNAVQADGKILVIGAVSVASLGLAETFLRNVTV